MTVPDRTVRERPTASHRFAVVVAQATALLVAAVLLRVPGMAILAAPFVLVLLVDVAWRPVSLRGTVRIDRDRVLEGDDATVRASVSAARAVDVEVVLALPAELRPLSSPRRSLHIGGGRSREVAVEVRATRWGGSRVGPLHCRQWSPGRLLIATATVGVATDLRTYPSPAGVPIVPRPRSTQVLAGNRTARATGSGFEFAELRAYGAGDRPRDVNWRVTARRGGLWVNARHPERNVDVVIVIDALAHRGLDRTVRATTTVAETYLRQRDRVAIVGFGGIVRWLDPGGGARHRWRVLDAVIDTQLVTGDAIRGLSGIPARLLTPDALVVVVSPFEDGRLVDALLELRGRDRDVAVLEVREPPPEVGDRVGDLAERLWRLERDATADRLRAVGVAVVTWPVHEDLAPALAALDRMRSRMGPR